MRFFDMPVGPHADTVNVDLDDGVGVRFSALRINCRCCLSRLITAQEFSTLAVELRRQNPDLPRHCQHIHTGLTGLLNRCGPEFVGSEPPQLSRRPVKAIGHRLDHSHHPKASRRSRHRSSHSDNPHARNYPTQHQPRQMGLLTACNSDVTASNKIAHIISGVLIPKTRCLLVQSQTTLVLSLGQEARLYTGAQIHLDRINYELPVLFWM